MKKKNTRQPRSQQPARLRRHSDTGDGPNTPSRPVPPPAKEDEDEGDGTMRLAKYVAHCGLCSRREAATHIKAGELAINGIVILEPGHRVLPGDVVTHKGQVIKPVERRVYILMNKPKGVVSTAKDERGRQTVIDLLDGKVPERVFPVGRLDRDTTGLLLLTNDGDLAKKLTHPSHQVHKVYYATLDRPMPESDLERIRKGLTLEDGVAPVDAVAHIQGRPDHEVGIELHVGRNRIVRRIFEHLGYEVQRLDRTYLGGLTKKNLPRGWWRHLSEQEIVMLKHFV